MKYKAYLLLSIYLLLLACTEVKKKNPHRIENQSAMANSHQRKAMLEDIIPDEIKVKSKLIPPISPPPIDPSDPIEPEPYPIDPLVDPFFIPPNCPPPPLHTLTLRDSLVLFPSVEASFIYNSENALVYVSNKVADLPEFWFLIESDMVGKIYFSVLIDIKGKVREVKFLRSHPNFKNLESQISKIALNMPSWTPAKNEQGQAVVSESILVIRIQE